jgi:hypothetical protein
MMLRFYATESSFHQQESDTSKCQQWDDLAQRHAIEVYAPANYRRLNHSRTLSMQVEAAAKKATEEVQREEKIKTEIVTRKFM